MQIRLLLGALMKTYRKAVCLIAQALQKQKFFIAHAQRKLALKRVQNVPCTALCAVSFGVYFFFGYG